MRKIRAFVENIEKGNLAISGSEGHHIINVLRMQPGQELELFDGRGTVAGSTIEKVARSSLSVSVRDIQKVQPSASGRIVIASSVARGHRFDQVVTQCTELGVDGIIPVVFERTVKQPKGKSVLDRYISLAVAASKQCGRDFLPAVTEPLSLEDAVDLVRRQYPSAGIIYGGFSDSSVSINKAVEGLKDIVVFVGPEGGLAESEECFLKDYGSVEVSVNKNILRIETAAAAFAAVLAAIRPNRQGP